MSSRLSYIFCVLFMLYACFFFYPKWDKHGGEATIGWDVSGYYWYLPSIFIYDDLKQQGFAEELVKKYEPTPTFGQAWKHESGNYVMVYSSGMAFMYLPAFTIAHLLAQPLGYPADGLSLPYQFALQMQSLLVALIGVWFFRRLFLLYYSDKVVAVLLLLLVFGTNYLNYSAIDGSQTHNYLLTLYVFLLLATHRFYETFRARHAVAIGLLCGLAILIRPSEMISVLIPLLWGLESLSVPAIKKRFAFLWKQKKNLFIAAACVILVGSIQLIYWFYVTGRPLVYSYQDKTFSWLHPHLYDYTLSFRSGWLRYTPLMLFSVIGIIPFLRSGRNKVAILCFFAINLYIVSAWDIWWYGGTGGRAMLHSYPIILFPFASFLQEMFRRKWLAYAAAPFILVFAYVNIWFTYNAHAGQGLYDSEGGMTRAYFWSVIGRYHVDEEIFKLKDTKELYQKDVEKTRLLYQNDFEKDTITTCDKPPIKGQRSLCIIPQQLSSPVYSFAYTHPNTEWVRAQATFSALGKEWSGWRMRQFIVRFTNRGENVKENLIRVDRWLEHATPEDLYIDVKVPAAPFDSVSILVWTPGSAEHLLMDDLKVWEVK